MKLKTLIQARRVINAHSQDKVSGLLAYKIMKFIKASQEEDAFYTDKIGECISLYAQKDDNGKIVTDDSGNIKIADGKLSECQKAIDDIEATNVDIPNVRFSLSDLTEMKLTAMEAFSLDEFIVEEG